jgi:hypothetical protein
MQQPTTTGGLGVAFSQGHNLLPSGGTKRLCPAWCSVVTFYHLANENVWFEKCLQVIYKRGSGIIYTAYDTQRTNTKS